MKTSLRAVAVLGLTLMASCAIQADLPKKFLELQSDSYQLKATSADDAIFWVRRFDGQTKDSTLEFWSEALKNNLVGARGYTLVESKTVKTKAGREGHAMVLEATVGGETQRELCVVFLQPGSWGSSSIYVAEYVAPKAVFEQYLGQVMESIQSLRF